MKPRLKEIREKLGKTQNEIAEYLGIDPKTYRKYEKGVTSISVESLILLSNYYSECYHYDISIDYIVGLSESPFFDPSLSDMEKRTHLSAEAIENIIYEGSESGDNRRIWVLNKLLSDKSTFLSLMDNIHKLSFPTTWVLFKDRLPEMFKDPHSDRTIVIKPEVIRQLSNELPESIYPEINNLLKKFSDELSKCIPPAVNEYHPKDI